MKWFKSTLATAGLLALLFNLVTTRLESYEVGLQRDWLSGETTVVTTPGIRFAMPWVMVAHIDTRPMRLCVTSSARAVLACKLARFNPEHINEFLVVEGWQLYWWSNRFSLNSGHAETYRGFRDVMRGYAFSKERYLFIEVLQEY